MTRPSHVHYSRLTPKLKFLYQERAAQERTTNTPKHFGCHTNSSLPRRQSALHPLPLDIKTREPAKLSFIPLPRGPQVAAEKETYQWQVTRSVYKRPEVSTSDHKQPEVSTSNQKCLQATRSVCKRPEVSTSDQKCLQAPTSDQKCLQVTRSVYKRPQATRSVYKHPQATRSVCKQPEVSASNQKCLQATRSVYK